MNLADYVGTNIESVQQSMKYLTGKNIQRERLSCKRLIIINIIAAVILIATLFLGR